MTFVLMPVPERQWREPSQAQPKDQFGNQNQTRFRLTARLNDGFIRWRGWFDSRDDADAFLYALALNIIDGTPVPVELWRLPSPWWHPDIGEGVTYDFATLVFLTTAGSLQTYTSAVDWWNSNNTVEIIAGAGSGGAGGTGTSGGGGGEYRKLSSYSISVPGTTTVQYEVGNGGAAVSGAGGPASGHAGGNSWWNGATYGAATFGAVAGGAGGSGGASGGVGGTGGVGGSGNAGGRGGNATAGGNSGGGGAGGPNGTGNQGVDTSSNTQTNGGSGDAGNGGTAGTAGVVNGGAGGNGIEWDASHGSGGGGGGGGTGNGGNGGTYGAGSGAQAGAGGSSGAGAQGIVVLTYTPFKRGAFIAIF